MGRRVGFWSAMVLAIVLLVGSAAAQGRVTVTANELIQRNHVLEVAVGTEVVWADPHFERVWFPSGPGEPAGRAHAGRLSGGVRTDRGIPGDLHPGECPSGERCVSDACSRETGELIGERVAIWLRAGG